MSGTYPEGAVDGSALTTQFGEQTENDCGVPETAIFDPLGCQQCGSDLYVLADMILGDADRRERCDRYRCAGCGCTLELYGGGSA